MNAVDRSHTGVCIVRVEAQSVGCLYTVISILDIAKDQDVVEARYVRMDEALEAARQFLERFDRSHHEEGGAP